MKQFLLSNWNVKAQLHLPKRQFIGVVVIKNHFCDSFLGYFQLVIFFL